MNDLAAHRWMQTCIKYFHTSEDALEHYSELSIKPEPPSFSSFEIHSIINPDSWINSIHYSWFLSILSNLPPPAARAAVGYFSEKDQQKIKKALNFSATKALVRPAQKIVRDFFKDKLQADTILAPHELPFSEMNILLTLSKSNLVYLIDMLAMYDLAFELKQVLDKTILSKIHSVLSKGQLQFLHYCSKQIQKWTPPPLNLSRWDGEVKTLKSLLHARGLHRLSKSLALENTSFLWHFTHRLDTGRGNLILKDSSQRIDVNLIPYFKKQVLHLAKRFIR